MIPRRCVTAAAVVLTAACALVPVPATAASARPLGDFTVHRYDGLVAAPGALRVRHVEDLTEIPATQAGPGAVVRAGSGVNRLLARRPPDNGPVGGAGAPERAPGIGVRRRPGGRIGVQGGGIRTRLSYFRGERENSPGCEWGAPCPRNRAVSG